MSTYKKPTINANDLIDLGYKPYQAKNLVRQAKQIMVNDGHPYYNNKRLAVVPRRTVEQILGFSLDGRNDFNED